ncbi:MULTISPECIES: cyclodeaminase/cyclohydrolase family protein [Amycolatopsis]|uniref:Cyclodeaminase/cyclohydrolase domain-containing protein n=2 Tax=Amycolatopsis TaxID=1813 RepID=A0ABP7IFK9_9PSEU|nr:cyclodeaminase/cyclohydrolase family protein [Amycolatopsis tucumanensis]MCF6424012.1 cyclodeaminase/cyclohydrolase family protein [Amycolatopsis tucumanensis]
MRTLTLEAFLDALAARVPAPGGGATAALHAAQGAALVAMVARYSDGEKYRQDADAITQIRANADDLRTLALALAEKDAAAFQAVTRAYALPKSTEREKVARSRAIGAALVEAGRVPARVIAVAKQIVNLTERLQPIGNRNVISDVAAAADAARAALSTARVNVEINLSGIGEGPARDELTAAIATVDQAIARADDVTTAVRKQITR